VRVFRPRKSRPVVDHTTRRHQPRSAAASCAAGGSSAGDNALINALAFDLLLIRVNAVRYLLRRTPLMDAMGEPDGSMSLPGLHDKFRCPVLELVDTSRAYTYFMEH